MAENLGVIGMPFAITVMVGASSSFISPMGYQTNLMVYGPGRYKFADFVKNWNSHDRCCGYHYDYTGALGVAILICVLIFLMYRSVTDRLVYNFLFFS
jgi:hypothetical protein